MEIIISILILLASGVILGQIFDKFGLPDIVGPILSGVILGPTIMGLITINSSLIGIQDISLFFLILLLGLEITTKSFTSHPNKSIILSLASFIIPMLAIAVVLYAFFSLSINQAVIVSIAVAVPSISIVSVLLIRKKMLGTEDGDRILSSVVISDILAFIILAAISNSLDLYGFLGLIITVSVFIAIMLLIAKILRIYSHKISGFFNYVSRLRNGETSIFAIVILLGLIIASFLELVGITFVLGAFFAGMLVEELIIGKSLFRKLIRTFRRIDNSFFIPLFFSIAGATATLPNPTYVVMMLIIIVMSGGLSTLLIKHFGRGVFYKLSPVSSMSILGGRGAVGIIIGSVALAAGVITLNFYSVILFATLIMSLFFPIFFKPKFIRMTMKRRKFFL